jgi:hypothetical protein
MRGDLAHPPHVCRDRWTEQGPDRDLQIFRLARSSFHRLSLSKLQRNAAVRNALELERHEMRLLARRTTGRRHVPSDSRSTCRAEADDAGTGSEKSVPRMKPVTYP